MADTSKETQGVLKLPGLDKVPGLEQIKMKTDPLGWASATGMVARRAMTNPAQVAAATTRFASNAAMLPMGVLDRALNPKSTPPLPVNPKDRRFSDPAWENNAAFFAMRQYYLAVGDYLEGLLAAGNQGDTVDDQKAAMALRFLMDSMAPTNFLPTNPAALVKAFQTGGRSVLDGAKHAVDDVVNRGGRPMKVDRSAFSVGKDLAATPGKVIYRNELIELIQYTPQTDQVYDRPLLVSPPWINKYYIMDLAPGRSLLEWAVKHKRTVFVISYRNPDKSMQGITMDDYLNLGPLSALEVVSEVTGAEKIDVMGLCLGGAMASMFVSYLNQTGDDRIGSLTLMNTLLDYTQPGELGTMLDPSTLKVVEERMAGGFLPADDMATTFDMLRANDLIFNYVVSRWLQGEPPSAFDILAWNEDSTRMPAAMHRNYLRDLYQNNCLAKGTMQLAGQTLELESVKNDVYIVGAINDHIVLWDASYISTQLFGGDVRYVLSSGGHIAGVVNPPSPKAWLEVNETGRPNPADPKQWREIATRYQKSWWEDWTAWAEERAGTLVDPPSMGSEKYRPLDDAPGTYVFG